jgi:hypothetical protein
MGSKIKRSAKQDRNRKSGQNLMYKAENRREKSHIRRIKLHLKRYGLNDRTACDDLMKYATKVGLHAVESARNFVAQRRAH